jgi:hypothetical protein
MWGRWLALLTDHSSRGQPERMRPNVGLPRQKRPIHLMCSRRPAGPRGSMAPRTVTLSAGTWIRPENTSA